MTTSTRKFLTSVQAHEILEKLEQAVTREACWSCECLQDLITRLELDAGDEVKQLLEIYEVRPERRHGSLGCHPCLPANILAEALRV